jgi:hypothetical protein
MSFAQELDRFISEAVDRILSERQLPDTNYISTDNFGEIVEKLIILHIRTWMLEDMIGEAKSDEELADIKRKIDICFKQKRPKFVEAINLLIDDSIRNNKSVREDSVKIYKGF